MEPYTLTQYLHKHIPLSEAMKAEVRAASIDAVTLSAPLAPNINHRDTLFGGSASACAILAAWTLLFVRLKAEALGGRIVIYSNTMKYEKPIPGDFLAVARAPGEQAWRKLEAALGRNRKARIAVHAELQYEGERAGELEGVFVVLPEKAR